MTDQKPRVITDAELDRWEALLDAFEAFLVARLGEAEGREAYTRFTVEYARMENAAV